MVNGSAPPRALPMSILGFRVAAKQKKIGHPVTVPVGRPKGRGEFTKATTKMSTIRTRTLLIRRSLT